MRIPAVWLREFVEVPEDEAGLAAFADKLTMAGLELEEKLLETPAGPTFYAKITPNRGDWASIYGAAREAAAAGRTPLKALPAAAAATQTGGSDARGASVTVKDAVGCPRYSATVLRNVTVGPSPQWMQDRLAAAGMRAINNVVDVTNYVMLELGQPLHAFDLDTLPDGAIVVRAAAPGETLKTLDGVERALSAETLCICDSRKPIAIAGIMGGGPTEVTTGTTNLLLESAHFDPLSIRRTAKRIGLSTEASYRFERYVDPNLVPIAAQRAATLLAELAGAEAAGAIDVYPAPKPPTRIMARVDRIRKLLGAHVERDAMIEGLELLGISVERSAGALDCVIPSYRPDLTIEDDIAEEVGRIALGYENLPATLPPLEGTGGHDSARGRFVALVRETLVRAGLQDVHTHTLTAPSDLATPEEAAQTVTVRSALSIELSSLRASLLPNLVDIAARAHSAGIRDIALFEVGPVYRKRADGSYREPLRVAGFVSGSALPAAWSVKPEALPADFYFAKGLVEALGDALNLRDLTWTPGAHPGMHPGRTALVSAGGTALGVVAEFSESTVAAHDLPRRSYVFDLDADALAALSASAPAPPYVPVPRFPAVVRDLAPVFERTVSFGAIESAVVEAAGPLLESVRLTDVYSGANVGEGRQALTLRFIFRSGEGTLTDVAVESALSAVRQALRDLGGELRL